MAATEHQVERNLFDTFNAWRDSGETPTIVLAALGETMLQSQIDIIGRPTGILWNDARGDDIVDIFVTAGKGASLPEQTTQLLGGTVVDLVNNHSVWVAEARPSQLLDEKGTEAIRYWRYALADVVYMADAGWPIDPRSEVQVVENSVHRQLTAGERLLREMKSNDYWYGNPLGSRGRSSANMGGPM